MGLRGRVQESGIGGEVGRRERQVKPSEGNPPRMEGLLWGGFFFGGGGQSQRGKVGVRRVLILKRKNWIPQLSTTHVGWGVGTWQERTRSQNPVVRKVIAKIKENEPKPKPREARVAEKPRWGAVWGIR